MDKDTLKTVKAIVELLDAKKAEKKLTLGDKLDKALGLATKAVALAALVATLLADIATKVLPALEILLDHLPRLASLIGPGHSAHRKRSGHRSRGVGHKIPTRLAYGS